MTLPLVTTRSYSNNDHGNLPGEECRPFLPWGCDSSTRGRGAQPGSDMVECFFFAAGGRGQTELQDPTMNSS